MFGGNVLEVTCHFTYIPGEPGCTERLKAAGASDECVQTASAAEGRVECPDLEHRELDRGIWVGGPQVLRLAQLAAGARPAEHSGLARGLVGGVGGVEPEHADVRVVPEREDKHHAAVHCLAHLLEAPLAREVVDVAKLLLLLGAEVVRDGVPALAAEDRCLGVGDDLAVLHVEAADFGQVARVRPVGRQELRHDGEGLGGVNLEVRTGAVEVRVAHPVGIVVAPVLVADAVVALPLLVVAARDPVALREARPRAGVRREGGGLAVRLPNIELSAAGAVVADGGHRRGVPVQEVCGTADELEVMRALRIAVASSVLGARGVAPAVPVPHLVHLHKIHGAVQATGQLADIHGHAELAVLQLVHLVGGLRVHHVEPRAEVLGIFRLRHEGQLDAVLVAIGGNAVCAEVVGPVNLAGRCALQGVGAQRRDPLVVLVAILSLFIHPSPIAVHHEATLLVRASAGRALLRPDLRVDLFRLGARLLR
mmetsp:Transcript_22060/g.60270  ORF Transcript_22060/g.60270 Transcript_22060/m.60270 type:complete len:481 (-) Transcript_22060:116-1558(-)